MFFNIFINSIIAIIRVTINAAIGTGVIFTYINTFNTAAFRALVFVFFNK